MRSDLWSMFVRRPTARPGERASAWRRAVPLAPVVVALALASLTLASCGGSSGSQSTQRSAVGSTGASEGAGALTTGGTAGTTPATATQTAKREVLRHALAGYDKCMREHGVQIPRPKQSSHRTSAEIQTSNQALTACRPLLRTALRSLVRSERHARSAKPVHPSGSSADSASTPAPAVPHIKPAATPAPVTAALEHFTACMHEHGIANFPEPDGAGFNVTHVKLDRGSAQFKAAEKACNPILQAIG